MACKTTMQHLPQTLQTLDGERVCGSYSSSRASTVPNCRNAMLVAQAMAQENLNASTAGACVMCLGIGDEDDGKYLESRSPEL